MAKFIVHGSADTVGELEDELPEGEPWGEYLIECVRLRKRVEARELVLTEPDTRTVEQRRG